MRTRNTYSKEYKGNAVNLVWNTGSTVAEIARDLDLNPSNLARWYREFDSDPKKVATDSTLGYRTDLGGILG